MTDYRPVALTSVLMKSFERLFLAHFLPSISNSLDPFQFAYRENRSVEDAVSLTLHELLQHLDTPRSYALVLFVDYSSAFNTIVPQKLFNKLIGMNVNLSLCHWILDFLLMCPQFVKFKTKPREH